MFHNRSETWANLRIPLLHVFTIWLGLVVAGYLLSKGKSSLAFRLIAGLAVADFTGTLLISGPTVYTSAHNNSWHAMNIEHVRNLDLTSQGLIRAQEVPAELAESHPNNRNLALKIATLDNYSTLTNRFHEQMIEDPVVRAMALGKDRIWFSADPVRVAPTGSAYAQFVKSYHSAGAPAFLLHSPAQMARLALSGGSSAALPLLPCERAEVTDLSYRANSIAFRYHSPSAGWIMITDRWAPGWHATVNGQPTSVWGADFLFRAVPVTPGSNDINLHYRPAGFLPLLSLSWGTLLAFAAVEVTRHFRRRPSENELEQENLRHLYLVSNGRKGRPNPLFDRAYYLRNNPDVEAHNIDPLVHYMTAGALELRSPHALFDARYYVEQYPEVLAAKSNPLLHFLSEGANRGYNPNPLFDAEYYLWRNPEVKTSGMNPLVHFLLHGIPRGLDPHPLFGMKDYAARYPDIMSAGTDPLSHYLEFGRDENRISSRALYFSEIAKTPDMSPRIGDGRTNPDPSAPLPVFCVYGPSHVEFLKYAVVPALNTQLTGFPVELHFLNYQSPDALAGQSIANVTDWSESRPPGHLGFGESVNYLFKVVQPKECFVICNPDSFPMPGCLTRLMKTYLETGAAIVEARQWPSAHPKEFNPITLETPWASGAFDLISAKAFAELGGFDPVYFLYLEDVDLSWRAWLNGFKVLHQPLALCTHATGLHTYQPTRLYLENFYSLRNFLVIAYKFWGELGERISLEYLKSAHLPAELHSIILDSYLTVKPGIAIVPAGGSNIANVKILGLNLFHELQR